MITNKQLCLDMNYISSVEFIPWDRFKDKTVLITGATGLIGYTLVNSLMYANQKMHLNLKVLALVRDWERAQERFKEISDNNALEYILGNVEELPQISQPVDFIIHGASFTDSRSFVKKPVETIKIALKGTGNILELAKQKKVSGIVYLSSMEVYGYPEKGHRVVEEEIGALTSLDVRNSYPISKIQCESLFCAYAKEYGLPATIVRLTQTFGIGVNYNDRRVFAEFARCVIEKNDIILKTKGETERSYLYTADAATAILTVLLKGAPAQAYNAANEKTYCSITKMAGIVAKQGEIKVLFDIQDESSNGYAKVLYMDLDTNKIQSLGWYPKSETDGLEEMYRILIDYMRTLA